MSNPRITTMVLAALLAMSAAVAADARGTAQQERMKQCNVEAKAKSLSGAERKQFMKSCLSTHHEQHKALTSQQERMKSCNAEAKTKGLKGADRRKFMSTCLKGG